MGGSLTTSPSLLLTPRLSATSTPTTSSSGPSTGPESRSTLPGWLVPRRPLLRVCPSPPTSTRSRPCEKVSTFDKTCLTYAKVLDAANGAAQKMTTHAEADAEVAALRERYAKVKAVSDEWVKKVDILLKEWTLLDNTVTELNSWVAKDKSSEGENQFSLEKMESTLGELKNIFKEKEKLVENL